jgi:NAD(P)H dehydrogenase (quinone)
MPLRVFTLYANPVAASFGAALRKQTVAALRSRGHEIDDCDLHAESFNPVMSEQERMQYHDVALNRGPIAAYADRLLAAEALVLIYPVWNEGFPAILKGFFDRVFIPGVSFTIGPDGAPVPNLQKLRKLAAVCTYGANRTTSFLLGDPPKRVVKRLVRSMPGHSVRCDYLAHYDMDHSSPEQRAAFLGKVKRTFEAW